MDGIPKAASGWGLTGKIKSGFWVGTFSHFSLTSGDGRMVENEGNPQWPWWNQLISQLCLDNELTTEHQRTGFSKLMG